MKSDIKSNFDIVGHESFFNKSTIENDNEKKLKDEIKSKIPFFMNLVTQIKTNTVNDNNLNDNILQSIAKTKNNQNLNKNIAFDPNDNKFTIKCLLNFPKTYNLEIHKRKFFKFTDEFKDYFQLNEEKLKRDILVSKLLRDDNSKRDYFLENNYSEKIIANSYLFFSQEARKLIAGNSADSQDNNFHNLMGINLNNIKDSNYMITQREIIGLCNRFIQISDLNLKEDSQLKLSDDEIERQKLIEQQIEKDKTVQDIIKSERTRKSIIEFTKKVDEINPLSINNTNSETIKPKSVEPEEELDRETIKFFKDCLTGAGNNQNSELIEKIANLMGLLEKSNSLSVKHKNEVLRQMKEKFRQEQENLLKKQKEEEKKKELLKKNKESRMDQTNNPFKETLDDISNVTKSKIINYSPKKKNNNGEVENYKSKIIYTNQGWGIGESVNKSKNFNSKLIKSTDKSFVSNMNNSKFLKKNNVNIISMNSPNLNLKKKNIKIDGNQKITKFSNKLIKAAPNQQVQKNKFLSNRNNSDEEFFKDFEDFD